MGGPTPKRPSTQKIFRSVPPGSCGWPGAKRKEVQLGAAKWFGLATTRAGRAFSRPPVLFAPNLYLLFDLDCQVGVFFETARQLTQKLEAKIILIHGDHLASSMIDHGLGFVIAPTHEIKKTDRDYSKSGMNYAPLGAVEILCSPVKAVRDFPESEFLYLELFGSRIPLQVLTFLSPPFLNLLQCQVILIDRQIRLITEISTGLRLQ